MIYEVMVWLRYCPSFCWRDWGSPWNTSVSWLSYTNMLRGMRWLFTHNSVVSGNWLPLNFVCVWWLEWVGTHTRTCACTHTHTCTEELDCILLWTGRVHVTQHGDSSLNYWQWRCAHQLVAYCIPTHLPVPPPPSITSPLSPLHRFVPSHTDQVGYCLHKRAGYVTGSYVWNINS